MFYVERNARGHRDVLTVKGHWEIAEEATCRREFRTEAGAFRMLDRRRMFDVRLPGVRYSVRAI